MKYWFTVALMDMVCDVRSSRIVGFVHVFVTCWSWRLDRSASERFSEEISFPLPESGESLEQSCWIDDDGRTF
jgi:hypothetical protein